MPFHSILSGDLSEFSSKLDALKYSRYDYIYLSIGGKLNEPCVTFQKPKIQTIGSNAQYQLVPEFLKKRHDDIHCLIIAIDHFNHRESYETNKQYLMNYSNFDTILVNKFFNLSYLETFIQILLTFVSTTDVDPANFMIANYIRYLNNPNELEAKLEFGIPDKIQQALNLFEDKRYCKCLFQWFGYNLFLYNMICNYNYYLFAMNQARHLSIHDNISIIRPFNLWYNSEYVQKPRTEFIWKYSYDITNSNITIPTKIVSSIFDNYEKLHLDT